VTARLANKRAIVTGAGRGIGRAIAAAFLREGARVVLNDINASLLDAAVAELDPDPQLYRTVVADVSDPNAVRELVAQAREAFGGVDVLVNNAGIGGVGKTLLELSQAEWHRMIDVDLTSVFLCCQAVVPLMIEQGRGCIINISSITVVEGTAGSDPYAAAKAGVIGLTKALAKDVAQHWLNVNAIAPGLNDT